MDPSEFHAPGAGRVVNSPEGYAAFVPAALPPRVGYTKELVLALSRADAALGELSGVGGELPDPQLLDASFKRQEALCSSRIEGAQVSLSDLYLDQVGAARQSVPRDHLREVRACISTLRFGVELLREEPLSLEFIKALHERLLRGEVGGARTPGEFRTSQNWLGPPGATMATATYVPAPVEQLPEALAAFEEFLQERGRLPDLIQCAMLHAQFESIHPFVGGNGRLGRLLITLFLIERQRLTRPLLYLSAFLEGHRDEYYTLLQRVRTHNEWTPWLTFFAVGVHETAERATRQARALIRHYERDREKVKGHALRLADELFRTPAMTVPEAKRVLEVDRPDGAARGTRARGARPARRVVRETLAARVPGAARPGRRAAPARGPAQRPRRGGAGRGGQVRGHAGAEAAAPRRPAHGRGHGHHRRGPRPGSPTASHRRPRRAPLLHRPRLHGPRVLRHRFRRARRPEEGDPRRSSRASTTPRTATSRSPPTRGSCSTSRTRRSRA